MYNFICRRKEKKLLIRKQTENIHGIYCRESVLVAYPDPYWLTAQCSKWDIFNENVTLNGYVTRGSIQM